MWNWIYIWSVSVWHETENSWLWETVTLWRQHMLTCDIIVQLFTRPCWVQHASSAQCDCQHSFPGLTRGAAHNHQCRHQAVVIRNGWMSFYGLHHTERFSVRLMYLCDLWDQCPGPPSASSLTVIVAVPNVEWQWFMFIYNSLKAQSGYFCIFWFLLGSVYKPSLCLFAS